MSVKQTFTNAIKPALTSVFTTEFPQQTDRNKVINEIAKGGDYQDNVIDENTGQPIPNPQSKADFIVDKLFNYLRALKNTGSVESKRASVDLTPDPELDN